MDKRPPVPYKQPWKNWVTCNRWHLLKSAAVMLQELPTTLSNIKILKQLVCAISGCKIVLAKVNSTSTRRAENKTKLIVSALFIGMCIALSFYLHTYILKTMPAKTNLIASLTTALNHPQLPSLLHQIVVWWGCVSKKSNKVINPQLPWLMRTQQSQSHIQSRQYNNSPCAQLFVIL